MYIITWLIKLVLHAKPDLKLLQVRQSAGLLLKNNLKSHYAATTEELRQYIKANFISGMSSILPLKVCLGTSLPFSQCVPGISTTTCKLQHEYPAHHRRSSLAVTSLSCQSALQFVMKQSDLGLLLPSGHFLREAHMTLL